MSSSSSPTLSDIEDSFENLSDSISSSPRMHPDNSIFDPMSAFDIVSSPSSTYDTRFGKQKSADEQDVGFKNHARFYFGDGNIVFVVQGIRYRVHRYFFWRDSQFFVNLLLNQYTNVDADDSSAKAAPITLEDVKCSEFEALLSILYPTNFHECNVKTVEDWTSVLRLATKWSFSSLRILAIERLEPIASPVDKVVLGRTYGITSWLVPGFTALSERPQSLSRDEGRRLGIDDVIIVAAVRETIRALGSVDRQVHDEVKRVVEARLASPENTDPVHVDAPSYKHNDVDNQSIVSTAETYISRGPAANSSMDTITLAGPSSGSASASEPHISGSNEKPKDGGWGSWRTGKTKKGGNAK